MSESKQIRGNAFSVLSDGPVAYLAGSEYKLNPRAKNWGSDSEEEEEESPFDLQFQNKLTELTELLTKGRKEKEERTKEEIRDQGKALLLLLCRNANDDIRESAKAVVEYFEDFCNYSEERKQVDTVDFDIYHYAAVMDKVFLEGDWNEFPFKLRGEEFSNDLHHLYAKSKFIVGMPEDVFILDTSGSYTGALFNMEDVVYTMKKDLLGDGEMTVYLKDLKANVGDFKKKRAPDKINTMITHFAGGMSFSYEPQQYRRNQILFLKVITGIYTRDSDGNLRLREFENTRDSQIAMDFGEIYTTYKPLRDHIKSREMSIVAACSVIDKELSGLKKENKVPAPVNSYDVAIGDGEQADVVRLMRHLNHQSKYEGYMKGMLKSVRHLGAHVLHGMAPPAAEPVEDEYTRRLREHGRDPFDVTLHDESLCAFFYLVATRPLPADRMYVLSDWTNPHDVSEAPKKGFFRGGVYKYTDTYYDVCAYLIGPPVIRQKGVAQQVDIKAGGGGRGKFGVIRVGFSNRCPENFKNLMEREGRGKFGTTKGENEWPEMKFNDNVVNTQADYTPQDMKDYHVPGDIDPKFEFLRTSRKSVEEKLDLETGETTITVKKDNEEDEDDHWEEAQPGTLRGFETLAKWNNAMEVLVQKLGKTQPSMFSSRTNNAATILSMTENKTVPEMLSKSMAAKLLNEASKTIGCQMLELQNYCCEQVMAAATKTGGDCEVFYSINHNNRIATLTRVCAPVQKFTGASQIVWVGGPTEYLGGHYEDMSWDPKMRKRIAISKALFFGKRQVKHASTAADRAMVHIVSHHMNLEEVVSISTADFTNGIDYGMIGHICAATINPTRNESVAISVGRWLIQIMSGLSGDPSAIAKKADVGVFMTQLSAYSVFQTLLRCSAIAVLRDAKEYNLIFPVAATDKVRTIAVAPTFTTGKRRSRRDYKSTVTQQQTMNNWYTCEILTGEHGNLMAANMNAVGLVFEILEEYKKEEVKQRLCGVSKYACSIWDKYKDRKEEIRKLLIQTEIRNNWAKFIEEEEQFIMDLAEEKETKKGHNSVWCMVEAGLRNEIKESTWDEAFDKAVHSNCASILTSKKGLQRHDEFDKKEGMTVAAAKAFLPGILPEVKSYDRNSVIQAIKGKQSRTSGTVLACSLRAISDGREGTAVIFNKYSSAEKDRSIAAMDWILRYGALVVETIMESVLRSVKGPQEDKYAPKTVPNSVLEDKDKYIPMTKAMKEIRAEIEKKISEGKAGEASLYAKGQRNHVIRLMNDASAWGPWKNLPSMYIYALACGMPPEIAVIVKAVIQMFINKEMVLQQNMQIPKVVATSDGKHAQRKFNKAMKKKERWMAQLAHFQGTK